MNEVVETSEMSGTLGCGMLFMLAPIPGYFMALHVNKLNPQKPPSYFQLWVGVAIAVFGVLYIVMSWRSWRTRTTGLEVQGVMHDEVILHGAPMRASVTLSTARAVSLRNVTVVFLRATEDGTPKTMDRGYGPYGQECYRTPHVYVARRVRLKADHPETFEFEVLIPAEQSTDRQEWDNQIEQLSETADEHIERWVMLVFVRPWYLSMSVTSFVVQQHSSRQLLTSAEHGGDSGAEPEFVPKPW